MVLPEPLAPRTTQRSPSATDQSIGPRMVRPARRTTTSCSSMITPPMLAAPPAVRARRRRRSWPSGPGSRGSRSGGPRSARRSGAGVGASVGRGGRRFGGRRASASRSGVVVRTPRHSGSARASRTGSTEATRTAADRGGQPPTTPSGDGTAKLGITPLASGVGHDETRWGRARPAAGSRRRSRPTSAPYGWNWKL